MRKRRRLANKMTMIVCAVLIAVSAFFYAPIEVDAASIYDSSYSFANYSVQTYRDKELANLYLQRSGEPITGNFDANTYYRLNGNFAFNATCDLPFSPRIIVYRYDFSLPPIFYIGLNEDDLFYEYSYSRGFEYIVKGSYLNTSFDNAFNMYFYGDSGTYLFDVDTNITINSIIPLTGEESASYEQGYNAGYSIGVQEGESYGYSSGYSDGYEAGEQSGYDSGFQAGSDSVDTQSYYDAGYSAGYDAGYLEGYDIGYDEGYDAGWSAYEAQMDKWGADTTDYPILVKDYTVDSFSNIASLNEPYPRDLVLNCWVSLSYDYNPNHSYKFVLQFDDLYMYRNNAVDYVFSSDVTMDCDIGGTLYPIRADADSYDVYYVPGNRVSSTLEIIWTLHNARTYSYDDIGEVGFQFNSLNVKVYDMGPSGDTQNHIANQTDQLTGGYNDSQGNSVNNDFSSGLNEFETAEDSLFATATTGLKDFTFFDFESVPAMVTGMSFVGSIMGSWFAQAGGASGVGIVLSILFSIMLVAMVLGLYRWYQSKGGKN